MILSNRKNYQNYISFAKMAKILLNSHIKNFFNKQKIKFAETKQPF